MEGRGKGKEHKLAAEYEFQLFPSRSQPPDVYIMLPAPSREPVLDAMGNPVTGALTATIQPRLGSSYSTLSTGGRRNTVSQGICQH